MLYYDTSKEEINKKNEEKSLNYCILKLRSKMLINNLNLSINNLYVFSVDVHH